MAEKLSTRPIPGYEGFYEVSACGRVFSLPRTVEVTRGRRPHRRFVEGRELRQQTDRYGYSIVTLNRDRESTAMGVHRVVCLAFHGEPPSEGMHAAHKDGVKDNNTPANVRWATVAENNEDRRRHGVHPMGERLPHAKLTADKAKAIVWRCAAGESDSALAREYGVSSTAIRKVRTGRSWAHATGFSRVPEIEAEIARLNASPTENGGVNG